MTGTGSQAPRFVRERAFYLGLNKVRHDYVAGEHLYPDHSYETRSRTRGAVAANPIGMVAGGSLTGSAETGVAGAAVSDLSDRGQLLAIAPQVFADAARSSVLVSSDARFEIGRNYHYVGAVRYRVRTHDDFREEGAHESAPRLGLWLIELPDSEPGEQAVSVTWVVLSGTAKGQLKTDLGGQVSDWRGGSQTEHLFEMLTSRMHDEERQNTDVRWLRDPYYALAARNLLNDSTEQHVETLFTCLDVHQCPTTGEGAEVSYLAWGPASTGREVPVSRVVLATPYFVQFTPMVAADSTPEMRSLWQRFRAYFGF